MIVLHDFGEGEQRAVSFALFGHDGEQCIAQQCQISDEVGLRLRMASSHHLRIFSILY